MEPEPIVLLDHTLLERFRRTNSLPGDDVPQRAEALKLLSLRPPKDGLAVILDAEGGGRNLLVVLKFEERLRLVTLIYIIVLVAAQMLLAKQPLDLISIFTLYQFFPALYNRQSDMLRILRSWCWPWCWRSPLFAIPLFINIMVIPTSISMLVTRLQGHRLW